MKCWCDLDSCGPAVYRWISANSGNVILLCEVCCADWRARASVGPTMLLAPSRITLLSTPVS